MTDIHPNHTRCTRSAPATLATAKHGGCVQLPAPDRARFEAWAKTHHRLGEPGYLEREQLSGDYRLQPTDYAWAAWQAALSAQPSPGGQGGAMELLEAYDQAVEDLSVERSDGWNEDNRRPQLEANVANLRAELVAALAPRQPVGDALLQAMRDARAEVFNNEPHVIATLNWLDRRAAEIAAQPSPGGQGEHSPLSVYADSYRRMAKMGDGRVSCIDVAFDIEHNMSRALAAHQPVGQEPVAYMVRWKPEGGFGLVRLKDMKYYHDRSDEHEIVPLFREVPPAQAVGLGQFNALAALANAVVHHGDESPMKNGVFAEAERLLAMIDSQAVGK